MIGFDRRRMGGGSARTTGAHVRHPQAIEGRKLTADEVIARIRRELASHIPGATLYLQSVQDLRIGGRGSAAQYQYTLQGDNLDDLTPVGAAHGAARMRTRPGVVDVNSDQQDKGLQASLVIDRATAARLGISAAGHRQHALRRLRPAPGLHHVHAAEPIPRGHGSGPDFWQNPDGLNISYVKGTNGARSR